MAKKQSKPLTQKVLLKTTERLPVKLTEDELLDFGQRLAQVESDASTHAAHADSVKKELKAKETALDAERSRLAGIVRSKHEPRDIDCHLIGYFETNRVNTIRLDTGEVVPGSERAMNLAERQESLELDPGELTASEVDAAEAPPAKRRLVAQEAP